MGLQMEYKAKETISLVLIGNKFLKFKRLEEISEA
jgi:hypothetical protein